MESAGLVVQLDLVEQSNLVFVLHPRDPIRIYIQKHLCRVTQLLRSEGRLHSSHKHFRGSSVPAGVGSPVCHAAFFKRWGAVPISSDTRIDTCQQRYRGSLSQTDATVTSHKHPSLSRKNS